MPGTDLTITRRSELTSLELDLIDIMHLLIRVHHVQDYSCKNAHSNVKETSSKPHLREYSTK